MLELNRDQRALLADKLPDAANVAAAALVFGQFLSERAFSLLIAISGAATWLLFMSLAIALRGRAR